MWHLSGKSSGYEAKRIKTISGNEVMQTSLTNLDTLYPKKRRNKATYQTLVICKCTTVRSKSRFAAHYVANIAHRTKPRTTGENLILPATIHTVTTTSLVPNTLHIPLCLTLLPAEFQAHQTI